MRQRAVALAQEQEVVRTRDLTNIGIPRCYLARMCNEGLLIKVGYGAYRAADQEATLKAGKDAIDTLASTYEALEAERVEATEKYDRSVAERSTFAHFRS
ncbi:MULTISPECIES: type IV toxin-antitoxin system AbiEi family antitoxin domain-containing protein [unclassified Mesorhizobium]|uniref:type IV toxin-antitoxin system AbiEi family antitoxin domain-containing protein n=2 Tax=unclassified Mesorhizobium TaxID=325217 RepID=UPI002484ABAD|nr:MULTISPECIES: type IV toxin-antitoxin system AbiEi family antitoxin domain-containing protein [unclassified Mesorhizobium]